MKLYEYDGRPGPRVPDGGDLFDLLSPVGRERFFTEYWQAKPLLIRDRAYGALDGVLDEHAIDALIGLRAMRPSDIRAVKNHEPIPSDDLFPDGVADKQGLLDAFASGHTLVFDKIDQHLPALASMLFRWEQDLKLPIRANAFYTPRGSSGFHRHYDTHDVIVIQVRGTKTWDVCDDPLPLPHEEQQRLSSHYASKARLIARIDLRPGDIAYLPRGFVHSAAASETDTLHLSVSIRNRSLRDVLSVALRARLLGSETHRKSVRLDSIDAEAIRSAILADIEAIDVRAAMADVRRGFLRQRVRSDRRLDAIGISKSIGDGTALTVALDAVFSIETGPDWTAIHASGERRRLTFDAAEAIGFAFAAGRFAVRDLPLPSGEQRVALARELHFAGLASVQSA